MTRENANEVVQIKKNDDLKLWEQTLWIWLLGTREFRDLGKRFVIASFWRNGNLTMKNLITKWWGRRGWFSTTRRKAEWHSYEMIKRIFNILKNISHNLRNPTYQKFKNLPGFWSCWSILLSSQGDAERKKRRKKGSQKGYQNYPLNLNSNKPVNGSFISRNTNILNFQKRTAKSASFYLQLLLNKKKERIIVILIN